MQDGQKVPLLICPFVAVESMSFQILYETNLCASQLFLLEGYYSPPHGRTSSLQSGLTLKKVRVIAGRPHWPREVDLLIRPRLIHIDVIRPRNGSFPAEVWMWVCDVGSHIANIIPHIRYR